MDKIIVTAELEQLVKVQQFIKGKICVRCSKDECFQLDLVIEELFVNIVQYAYPSEIGQIEISYQFKPEENKIYLCVVDTGIPFNPLDRPDPDVDSDTNKRGMGALGIYLIRNCMDQITYQRDQDKNVLRLTKEIEKQA